VIATSIAYLLASVIGGNAWAAAVGGFIPARISGALVLNGAAPVWLTPLTSTIIHGGLIHLLFNMLMLGYCGREVELATSPRAMILLYVAGAYAAAFAQYVAGPLDTAPMVGASGAASAVLGAYALIFGRRRVRTPHPLLNRALHVVWLAAAWIGIQLLMGLAGASGGMPIAIAAHIGGFLAGLALAGPLLRWRYRDA
jgi:membrane associated rhomboid family serine protease